MQENQNQGESEGRPRGEHDWIRKGYELVKSESGDLERDFWLGRPFGSEGESVAPLHVLALCK